MPEPLQQQEIEALSADADRFLAELDEESYLHFAGLKETFDLAPIYERHERLTQLDTALALGASLDGDRRRRELWKFACGGYLGSFVSEEAERVAELEATLAATVDGDEIPFRMLKPRLMNEDDRDARERIESARNELTNEHLNALELQAAQVVQRETRRLGADGALFRRLRRHALRRLRAMPAPTRRYGGPLGGSRRPLLPLARRPRARRAQALGRRPRLARRSVG